MTIFDLLVLFGAILTLAGFAGLIFCIARVIRARRRGLSDEEMRAVLQAVLPINLAALGISVLGLMLVVLGIFLA